MDCLSQKGFRVVPGCPAESELQMDKRHFIMLLYVEDLLSRCSRCHAATEKFESAYYELNLRGWHIRFGFEAVGFPRPYKPEVLGWWLRD